MAWLQTKTLVHPRNPEVRLPLDQVAKGKAGTRRAMWYSIVLGMRDRVHRVNAKIERAAALLHSSGDEEGATQRLRERLVPLFPTGTLPSEWHPNPTNGVRLYDPSLSPDAGVRELGARWHRAMTLMRELDIPKFGLRTLEPHEDGSAHLHALLYVRSSDVVKVKRILGLQWPSTTTAEEDARGRGDFIGPAMKIKEWETRVVADGVRAADPASYIMTYVLKGLDGDGGATPDTLLAGDEISNAAAREQGARAAAWASSVGVRRISLVGLAPGTIGRWETLHRAMRGNERQPCPRARAIVHAMRRRQWATVLALLGAFDLKPSKRMKSTWQPRLATIRETRIDCWGDKVIETAGYYHPGTGEVVGIKRPVKWVVQETVSPAVERDRFQLSLVTQERRPTARAAERDDVEGRPPDEPRAVRRPINDPQDDTKVPS